MYLLSPLCPFPKAFIPEAALPTSLALPSPPIWPPPLALLQAKPSGAAPGGGAPPNSTTQPAASDSATAAAAAVAAARLPLFLLDHVEVYTRDGGGGEGGDGHAPGGPRSRPPRRPVALADIAEERAAGRRVRALGFVLCPVTAAVASLAAARAGHGGRPGSAGARKRARSEAPAADGASMAAAAAPDPPAPPPRRRRRPAPWRGAGEATVHSGRRPRPVHPARPLAAHTAGLVPGHRPGARVWGALCPGPGGPGARGSSRRGGGGRSGRAAAGLAPPPPPPRRPPRRPAGDAHARLTSPPGATVRYRHRQWRVPGGGPGGCRGGCHCHRGTRAAGAPGDGGWRRASSSSPCCC